jgi:hypothetical protein
MPCLVQTIAGFNCPRIPLLLSNKSLTKNHTRYHPRLDAAERDRRSGPPPPTLPFFCWIGVAVVRPGHRAAQAARGLRAIPLPPRRGAHERGAATATAMRSRAHSSAAPRGRGSGCRLLTVPARSRGARAPGRHARNGVAEARSPLRRAACRHTAGARRRAIKPEPHAATPSPWKSEQTPQVASTSTSTSIPHPLLPSATVAASSS